MASAKKPNDRRGPAPAGQERMLDAPGPAIVSATAPLHVVPPPAAPDRQLGDPHVCDSTVNACPRCLKVVDTFRSTNFPPR
jgi:hypothetical protein